MNIIYLSSISQFLKKVKHWQENLLVCCEGSPKFSRVTKSPGWCWFINARCLCTEQGLPSFDSLFPLICSSHLCGTCLNSSKAKRTLTPLPPGGDSDPFGPRRMARRRNLAPTWITAPTWKNVSLTDSQAKHSRHLRVWRKSRNEDENERDAPGLPWGPRLRLWLPMQGHAPREMAQWLRHVLKSRNYASCSWL